MMDPPWIDGPPDDEQAFSEWRDSQMEMTKPDPDQSMRIIGLEASNFKRLKAVRIKPDGTLVRIEGCNGAGKSSVLDAIAAALGGAKQCPDVPIRRGTNTASVEIDLGDLVVERTFTTKGGTALEVRTKDGVPQKSPQAILDKLLGDLTFDPEGFVNMKPADQLAILKRLAGLDFAKEDAERESIYHQRKAANVELRSAEASLGDAPVVPPNLPDKPTSMTDLAQEYQEALATNRAIDDHAGKITRAEGKLATLIQTIDRLAAELAQAGKDRAELEAALAVGREQHSKMQPANVAAIKSRMETIEETNRLIEKRRRYREAQSRIESLETVVTNYTNAIESIDQAKRERLMAAKFPLPDLSIDDTGPTLKGLPFAQASQAEQLRASVAIAMAQRPKLPIMLVRDGSRLDNNSMKLLREIAEEYDAQVFVERVSDVHSPAAVVIEDGEVVSEPETS